MSNIELHHPAGAAPVAMPRFARLRRAVRELVAPRSDGATGDMSLYDRIDQQAETGIGGAAPFNAEAMSRVEVVLCGDWDAATRCILNEAIAPARSKKVVSSPGAVPHALGQGRAKRQLLLIQIDAIERPVEYLVEIRSRFPNAAVILLSRGFARNDFSGERRAICDSSVKEPTSRASFAMAVTAAFGNHDEYLARRLF